MSEMDELRERVRAALALCPTCGQQRVTQRQVAREAVVKESMISNFLAGKRGVSYEHGLALDRWVRGREERR